MNEQRGTSTPAPESGSLEAWLPSAAVLAVYVAAAGFLTWSGLGPHIDRPWHQLAPLSLVGPVLAVARVGLLRWRRPWLRPPPEWPIYGVIAAAGLALAGWWHLAGHPLVVVAAVMVLGGTAPALAARTAELAPAGRPGR